MFLLQGLVSREALSLTVHYTYFSEAQALGLLSAFTAHRPQSHGCGSPAAPFSSCTPQTEPVLSCLLTKYSSACVSIQSWPYLLFYHLLITLKKIEVGF